MSVAVFDPRFAAVAHGAGELQCLCTGAEWSEGPVWMSEDRSLLWSDIPNNRVLRWHAASGMTVWRDGAEFSNGHAREADGSLLHCSHGLRAIVRTKFGPGLRALGDEVLVSHYQGRRLNSPNDVVVKRDGSIWFTDPPYGILGNREGHRAESELGANHVFRFDPVKQEGLANVDSSVIEASRIDGARWWQQTFLVKLPMVMHVIAITLMMRLIGAFRVLEVIYVLTFGGPGDSTEILSLHIYKTTFVGQQLGVAAAISVLLLVVVALLSWGALRLSNPMKGEPR